MSSWPPPKSYSPLTGNPSARYGLAAVSCCAGRTPSTVIPVKAQVNRRTGPCEAAAATTIPARITRSMRTPFSGSGPAPEPPSMAAQLSLGNGIGEVHAHTRENP